MLHRYDLGGEHPLVGRGAPDLELAADTRLADHGPDGRAVLLDLADSPQLREVAADWAGRVSVVTAGCAERSDLAGPLVRPDGYVAWATGGTPDLGALRAALARWLGSPALTSEGSGAMAPGY